MIIASKISISVQVEYIEIIVALRMHVDFVNCTGIIVNEYLKLQIPAPILQIYFRKLTSYCQTDHVPGGLSLEIKWEQLSIRQPVSYLCSSLLYLYKYFAPPYSVEVVLALLCSHLSILENKRFQFSILFCMTDKILAVKICIMVAKIAWLLTSPWHVNGVLTMHDYTRAVIHSLHVLPRIKSKWIFFWLQHNNHYIVGREYVNVCEYQTNIIQLMSCTTFIFLDLETVWLKHSVTLRGLTTVFQLIIILRPIGAS